MRHKTRHTTAFTGLLVALLALLALAPGASAFKVIGEPGKGAGQMESIRDIAVDTGTGQLYVADGGNHRIDVFDAEGEFEKAVGWGVKDGQAELQVCTTICQSGIEGGGAGQFSQIIDIAVDNDPTSPSRHDLYVLDSVSAFVPGFDNLGGQRIQKFTPGGEFVLALGGGVITAGAAGSGNLSAGSTEVGAVHMTSGRFQAGQTLSAPGKIPSGTKVVAVGPERLSLSKPAIVSSNSVSLSVAEGAGNVAVNERQLIGLGSQPGHITFATTNEPISAETPLIPPGSSASVVQTALENLPSIGPGNVTVSGPTGGLYAVEFKGGLADTDVLELHPFAPGSSTKTLQNGHSGAEVCPAAIVASCVGATEGKEGKGAFGSNAVLTVGHGGDVYVANCVGGVGTCSNRVERFDVTTGSLVEDLKLEDAGQGRTQQIATDPGGDFTISTSNSLLQKYDPSGNLLSTLDPGSHILYFDADAVGNLFVTLAGDTILNSIGEYDAAGDLQSRFGYGLFDTHLNGVVAYQSASGDLYASEDNGSRVIHLDLPKPGPQIVPGPCHAGPLGNTKATLTAEVNPEGKATKYHFELVDDATYQKDVADLGAGHGFDHAKREPAQASEDPSLPADFDVHEASSEAVVVPETKYHCRAAATNADATASGEEGVFTSLPPLQIGANWSSDVEAEVATLNAEVNPLSIPTTAYFEYVSDASYQKDIGSLGPGHGFDHASRAPQAGEGSIDLGAGEGFKVAKVAVLGLDPGTAYRWRIVATDPYFPQGLPGAVQAFRTFRAGEAALSDQRAWELVSPGLKNSAEVAVPSWLGGIANEERSVRIQAASDSGEAVTYTSWTSFGETGGAPSASQYLSKRSADGWGTENISPFGVVQDPLLPPYRGFTSSLDFSAFVTSEPPLTPEAQTGLENLYLRNNQTGALQALTTEAPQVSGGGGFCASYAGASADGKHAIFAARGAMAGAPTGKGFSLYEWSAGKGLELVSVLPDGSPAPPVAGAIENPGIGTGFGAVGSTCTMGQGAIRNAISKDGSVIFWTYGGKYKSSEGPLMARIGGETVQLDAKPSVGAGSGPFGGGKFLAATGDGSKAFFTAPGKLTSSAANAGQIYRYDTVERTLTDLTPGVVAPELEGLAGASDDGSYLYFVAKGALDGAAKKGAHNLYLWHEGDGVHFIGALSELDYRDWEAAPERLSARVTPDGRHLAFLSVEAEALSGYNNLVFPGAACQPQTGSENGLTGDPHCAEAYLYDAVGKTLTCVSCNPSGSRPVGPTQLPTWSNPYEGPRYLSDDGSRFYFESRDVLSGADENGKRDVYEFERAGTGSCKADSPGFSSASDGCVALISSGKGEDESYLLDASSSGRDVFFSTRSALVGWDVNENYDVYDAREGGGFAEPTSVPVCQVEACKPPPAPVPPSGSSPATATFEGPGNAAQKPKKKHKSKKHKSAKHKRANHKRRAGR